MRLHCSRWSSLAALACILIFSISIPPGISSQLQDVLEGRGSWMLTLITLTVVVGAWFVSVLLLATAAFSRTAVKWSIFLLASASFMGMAAYHEVAGRALEYPDYLILWQARANTWDALREYAASAVTPLAYVAVLWLGFSLARPHRWASPAAVVLLCTSVGIFTGVCVAKRGAGTNKLPTTTGVYGLFAAHALDHKNETYVYTSLDRPEHVSQVQNIVLVIDESVRHDFFQRVVGANLKNAAASGWQVYDFGLATSMANCSSGSNIMLRKGVRSTDIAEDLYRQPLIWSYAHNAGFVSYLLDAQGNGMGHDYFDVEERALIEHRLDVRDRHQDAELLDAMPYLDAQSRTFSLVIKHGAHFPYSANYPNGFHSMSSVSTHPYVQASQKRQEYVDALSWQTGGFFDKLLSMRVAAPTMVIYTSDHGQNVDDQPGLTHCTSSGMPYVGEGLVPLVILTNYADDRLAQAAITNQNLLSHFNIVPTILDAMGYESSRVYRDPSAAVTVPQPVPVPGFAYGSPFGYFGSAVQIDPVDRTVALSAANERWAGE